MHRRAFLMALPATALAGMAWAADTRMGSFKGKSGHVTTGRVSVEKRGGGYVVVLADDFFFDGAPTPSVGFGKNGYDKSANLGALRSNTGGQEYAVPAGMDPSQFNEVWIWCDKFRVPLGVAKLPG